MAGLVRVDISSAPSRSGEWKEYLVLRLCLYVAMESSK
jgi:hypothetical protein